jgi:bacterial/archaeal transporter family protein
MTWWMFALVSALAASATAILAKIGIKGVPSNLATAVRTGVVLVFAWAIVFASDDHRGLRTLKARSVLFLVLSGIGTGISWLAYFKALQMAPASRVAPIDKLSLAFTIVLASLVLGEPISWRVGLGAALIVGGALLTLGG